jgi:hypothetical protein
MAEKRTDLGERKDAIEVGGTASFRAEAWIRQLERKRGMASSQKNKSSQQIPDGAPFNASVLPNLRPLQNHYDRTRKRPG